MVWKSVSEIANNSMIWSTPYSWACTILTPELHIQMQEIQCDFTLTTGRTINDCSVFFLLKLIKVYWLVVFPLKLCLVKICPYQRIWYLNNFYTFKHMFQYAGIQLCSYFKHSFKGPYMAAVTSQRIALEANSQN